MTKFQYLYVQISFLDAILKLFDKYYNLFKKYRNTEIVKLIIQAFLIEKNLLFWKIRSVFPGNKVNK